MWLLAKNYTQVLQALDGSERSHGTLLLQKTQENLEAQAELQNKRQEFHSRMLKLKEREKELQLRVCCSSHFSLSPILFPLPQTHFLYLLIYLLIYFLWQRIEFNEQVAKFTKFMNDNEEKRNRANKRALEEIKSREGLVCQSKSESERGKERERERERERESE
jgi:hypothetical protein